ncbi:MAG: 50S ribosomal protein L11 methyltransferase [Desulfuromonas sp.]|nr:50S ribosomal protein L11 methyltransferase [Desulfuromonas sp.]
MGREFTPFNIGNKFCIYPEDYTQTDNNRINITMAAGAFGSGEHETTACCLEIMENLPEIKGARVLDLGSGTGILSIAALKLGAQSALCVDIDPAAIVTCQRNCELNNCAKQVKHLCATLDKVEETDFDFIFGNIYGDILLEVAADLVAKCAPQAPLLLSGMLYEYNFDVRQKYQRLGCQVLKNSMLEEFSTVLLRKK